MNNPVATLTKRGTIRIVIPEWADGEWVKRIPGRIWTGSKSACTYEIPADEESTRLLLKLLPSTFIDDSVDAHLGKRRVWEARVEAARTSATSTWPDDLMSVHPYDHQRRAYSVGRVILEESPAYGIWHDAGLGKTLTTLGILGGEHADSGRTSTTALVVCPATVIGVWAGEAEKFAAYPLRVTPLTGDTTKRAARVMSLSIDTFEGVTLLVTNYESLWREVFLKHLLKANIDIMVCDEAHRLKNPGSKQSIAARKIGAACKRIAATGTPVDTLTDWYGIYRWLHAPTFGTSSTAFRARYFHEVALGDGIKIVTGPKEEMLGELNAKAHFLAHACSKDDALDLPERIDVDRVCELEPRARKMYDEMRREAIAFLDSGEAVVGQNALTRLLRLQQITGGFIDGECVSDAKLILLKDTLKDLLNENEKVVVFARFTAEINAIYEMVNGTKLNMSGQVQIIDGRTKVGVVRDQVIKDFQEDDKTRVLVVQTTAGREGITLHRSSCAVFYSLGHSSIEFDQARSRIHRIGQENKCSYFNLLCGRTVDEKILQSLRSKTETAQWSVHKWREVFDA